MCIVLEATRDQSTYFKRSVHQTPSPKQRPEAHGQYGLDNAPAPESRPSEVAGQVTLPVRNRQAPRVEIYRGEGMPLDAAMVRHGCPCVGRRRFLLPSR